MINFIQQTSSRFRGLALALRGAVLLSLLASSVRAQDAYTWNHIPLGPCGYVDGMVINPNSPEVKYARTDVGGAYRWETSGHWTPITDSLIATVPGFGGIESIAIDPSHAQCVYIAGGSTIYKSLDRGNTWMATPITVTLKPNDPWRSAGERLAVDPNRGGTVLFFGTRSDGLWKSTTSGGGWARVTALPNPGTADAGVSFVAYDKRTGSSSKASKTIYVGVMGSGVYRSINGGNSWSLLRGGPDATYWPQQGAVASDGSLYVTYSQVGTHPRTDYWTVPVGGAVYKFVSGAGRKITPADSSADGGKGYCALCVDPTNPQHIETAQFHFLSGNVMHRSLDGGATWATITPQVTKGEPWWPDFCFSTGIAALVIDPGNPDETWDVDGFAVWSTVSNKLNIQPWADNANGVEELVANFAVKVPGGPLLEGVEDMLGFTQTDLTQPPLAKWDNTTFGMGTGIDYCATRPLSVARVGGDGDGNPLGRYSDDGGVTWTPFQPAPFYSAFGQIAVSATDPKRMVYASSTGGYGVPTTPYYTIDRGTTWHIISGGPQGVNLINDRYQQNSPLASDRVNGSKFYLYAGHAYYHGEFYQSVDGGATWTLASSNSLPNNFRHCMRALPGVEGELWLSFTGDPSAAQNGLFRSQDGGVTWVRLSAITDVASFGFGKAAPGQSRPAVFVYGTINGVRNIYRSDDAASQHGTAAGATWVTIGGPALNIPLPSLAGVSGDPDIYGKIYIATGGRGVYLGTPR